MSLDSLMQTELPLNRKERFYTGTVFPMIVCRENFMHFARFTSLIPGFREQEIVAPSHSANIQLFTEYSFVESVFGDAKKRFPNPPATKETPDIMILIKGSTKVLIAIEAKMFDCPGEAALRTQMQAQAKIVLYLQDTLQIHNIHHLALLPAQQINKLRDFEYPVISWQDLYRRYKDVAVNEYFMEVLRLALDNYGKLVTKGDFHTGQNSIGKLSGREIYSGFKKQALKFSFMGRAGGLFGPKLGRDVESGQWRFQKYEVNCHPTAPNRNWFSISDFVALVDQHKSPLG